MTEEDVQPTFGSPDESRGGIDIDAAVANAEAGSQVEGVHIPSGQAESGQSRLEQMVEVDVSPDRGDSAERGEGGPRPPAATPGPLPGDTGSGGAQRVVGARISDRVAGGEPGPDGPPFAGSRGPGESGAGESGAGQGGAGQGGAGESDAGQGDAGQGDAGGPPDGGRAP